MAGPPCCSGLSVGTSALVMVFAVSSWVVTNAMFVELPLMVGDLPEGWALPSYLVVIIQVANLGPLMYTVVSRLAPDRVKEWPMVYFIITVDAMACVLTALFWRQTSWIAGAEHSTALLVLCASFALVDTTSSVVYLPYMSLFKPQYMAAYYAGEGLSGLIPGFVALAQGVGADPDCKNTSYSMYNTTLGANLTEYRLIPEYKPPIFAIDVFFYVIFGILILSGLAFTCLQFASFCQSEKVNNHINTEEQEKEHELGISSESTSPDDVMDVIKYKPVDKNVDARTSNMCNLVSYVKLDVDKNTQSEISHVNIVYGGLAENEKEAPDIQKEVQLVKEAETSSSTEEDEEENQALPATTLAFMLLVTGWINALMNGVLPSIQSYSALPYGNQAYTLAVRLSTLANPLACFLALFLPTRRLSVVGVLAILATAMTGHQLYLASMSPHPPLQGEPLGEALVILTAVLHMGIIAYIKVVIGSLLSQQGRRAMLWCGATTQVGSFLGAVTTFILINVFDVFVAMAPCS